MAKRRMRKIGGDILGEGTLSLPLSGSTEKKVKVKSGSTEQKVRRKKSAFYYWSYKMFIYPFKALT